MGRKRAGLAISHFFTHFLSVGTEEDNVDGKGVRSGYQTFSRHFLPVWTEEDMTGRNAIRFSYPRYI